MPAKKKSKSATASASASGSAKPVGATVWMDTRVNPEDVQRMQRAAAMAHNVGLTKHGYAESEVAATLFGALCHKDMEVAMKTAAELLASGMVHSLGVALVEAFVEWFSGRPHLTLPISEILMLLMPRPVEGEEYDKKKEDESILNARTDAKDMSLETFSRVCALLNEMCDSARSNVIRQLDERCAFTPTAMTPVPPHIAARIRPDLKGMPRLIEAANHAAFHEPTEALEAPFNCAPFPEHSVAAAALPEKKKKEAESSDDAKDNKKEEEEAPAGNPLTFSAFLSLYLTSHISAFADAVDCRVGGESEHRAARVAHAFAKEENDLKFVRTSLGAFAYGAPTEYGRWRTLIDAWNGILSASESTAGVPLALFKLFMKVESMKCNVAPAVATRLGTTQRRLMMMARAITIPAMKPLFNFGQWIPVEDGSRALMNQIKRAEEAKVAAAVAKGDAGDSDASGGDDPIVEISKLMAAIHATIFEDDAARSILLDAERPFRIPPYGRNRHTMRGRGDFTVPSLFSMMKKMYHPGDVLDKVLTWPLSKVTQSHGIDAVCDEGETLGMRDRRVLDKDIFNTCPTLAGQDDGLFEKAHEPYLKLRAKRELGSAALIALDAICKTNKSKKKQGVKVKEEDRLALEAAIQRVRELYVPASIAADPLAETQAYSDEGEAIAVNLDLTSIFDQKTGSTGALTYELEAVWKKKILKGSVAVLTDCTAGGWGFARSAITGPTKEELKAMAAVESDHDSTDTEGDDDDDGDADADEVVKEKAKAKAASGSKRKTSISPASASASASSAAAAETDDDEEAPKPRAAKITRRSQANDIASVTNFVIAAAGMLPTSGKTQSIRLLQVLSDQLIGALANH